MTKMAVNERTVRFSNLLYEGRRISYDGALCTVRFYGLLSGTKGEWLGVEWDDASRGKHNGTHKGEQIFKCLSSSQTAASFVRPNRPTDLPRDFLEALRFKYGGGLDNAKYSPTSLNNNTRNKPQTIEISGKAAEEIGFDIIRKQQAELSNLRVAILDEIQLCGISSYSEDVSSLQKAQEEIEKTCPNIVELDLGWSLIETWSDVVEICRPLKKLRILKVSGVRLRSFSIKSQQSVDDVFANVQELQLNENMLGPGQIRELLQPSGINLFPSLKTLWLAQNSLKSLFDSASPPEGFCMPSVRSLILDNNIFTDLLPVCRIVRIFPGLESLSLQGNRIKRMNDLNDSVRPDVSYPFVNIKALNLSGNNIASYSFIDSLAILFPNLLSLRISKTPLYDDKSRNGQQPTSVHLNASYNLTLARIPSLATLNYTNFTTRDREEGEIYYLSVAEKELIRLFDASSAKGIAETSSAKAEAGKRMHPRYEELCQKHERDSVLARYLATPASELTLLKDQTFAPGSLAARLIQAKFYIPATFNGSDILPVAWKSFSRPISRTIDVYRVKAMLSREWGLPPLHFRMIYQSIELDPIRDGLDESTDDWEKWGDWNVDEGLPASSVAGLANLDEGRWENGVLHKDGKRWKTREVEIIDGTKAWGDYIGDDTVREVTIRVEPFDVIEGG